MIRPRGYTSLPQEIVLVIAQQLLSTGRLGDLAALSRLERRYSHLLQTELFRHICVESYDRCTRLVRALQPVDNNDLHCLELASLVRQLTVTLNPRPVSGGRPFTTQHLLDLYSQLPIIERIYFSGRGDCRLGGQLVPTIQETHRMQTFSTIRSLTLMGSFDYVAHLMLINLPGLEELHLFVDIPVSRFAHSSPHSGQQIQVLTWGSSTPPTLQRIRWLFANSETPLSRGDLVLLVSPAPFEREAICEYALRRNMRPHLPVIEEGANA